MTLLELNNGRMWCAYQAAKGTPIDDAAITGALGISPIWVAGAPPRVSRTEGESLQPADDAFADAFPFVETIDGTGTPAWDGQASVQAWTARVFNGGESVSSSGAKKIHESVPTGPDPYFTNYFTFGEDVGPVLERSNDCRLASYRVEASQASKVCRITPQILAVDPSEVQDTAPTKANDTADPMLWTEVEGRAVINGVNMEGIAGFAAVFGRDLQISRAQSPRPHDVFVNRAAVSLENIPVKVDQDTLDFLYSLSHGDSSPAHGAKPTVYLPDEGDFSVDMRKGKLWEISFTGSPTGGTFTPSINGTAIPAPITYAAGLTPAAVQTALRAHTAVPSSEITVTGTNGGPFLVRFDDPDTTMTIVDSLTGGTTPDAVVTDLGADEQAKYEFPEVRWGFTALPDPNPGGGEAEVTLTARVLSNAGGDRWTGTFKTAALQFTG